MLPLYDRKGSLLLHTCLVQPESSIYLLLLSLSIVAARKVGDAISFLFGCGILVIFIVRLAVPRKISELTTCIKFLVLTLVLFVRGFHFEIIG